MDLDQTDDGRVVHVKQGEVVTVRLPENPTTGYRWQLEPLDGDVLAPLDDQYVAGSALAGAGGARTLRLSAARSGQAQVVLSLRRSWEKKAPIRTFSVTVSVA